MLILLSLLTLIAAWLARWWFWQRKRNEGRRVACSMTVAELHERLGLPQKKPVDLRDAAALGNALRDCGLRLLENEGDRLARKRRSGWWSLRILPGLVAVVLIFAMVTRHVAPGWVLACGMLVIALHVVLRVSNLGIELKAVKRAAAELERQRVFRRMSEEEAVLDCARASVWETILPW